MSELNKVSVRVQEFRKREKTILLCALDLFLEHGEDKVTVEMIADRVGIGKGTIYKHFETKSEIYLRLMINYELELAHIFRAITPHDDKDKLMRDYFTFLMKDPKRYALFYRLEQKCMQEAAMPDLMEQLHAIRASNEETLKSIINARIEEGMIENVPEYFHICAAWALVHGAVHLYENNFFGNVIEDKDAFLNFLMDIGVRMGNKGQYHRRGEPVLAEDSDLNSIT